MTVIERLANRIQRVTTTAARRELARLMSEIGGRGASLADASDAELRARFAELRASIGRGAPLDDHLVDTFAIVREAAERAIGLRPFDVQVMGGLALHRGMIAEMKTGEGKTLAATMPIVLNALAGKGVHVATVNDYLVKRDAEWMGAVYRWLGLSVATIRTDTALGERKAAYAADITYGLHTEFAFDYLRDNMAPTLEQMNQRSLDYAIIDEVDSVLIDEARMPIEIMQFSEDPPQDCYAVDRLVRQLEPDLVDVDAKLRRVHLTEAGIDRTAALLRQAGLITAGDLYDHNNLHLVGLVSQALYAHHLQERDKDYVVKDGAVVLVDEVRGRILAGRRLPGGLHEALEAKEGLALSKQGTILGQTSYQNFFRLYRKLAGMTGTAMADAEEYIGIYGLGVIEIQPNKPTIRKDHQDEVYRTEAEKLRAVAERVGERHRRGQPILLGTTSVGKSERLSAALREQNIPHEVLNARQHEREAEVIAMAGRSGAVTIATNMAGRGTDIQLGGNREFRIARETAGIADQAARQAKIEAITAEVERDRKAVCAAGGLLVLGTERYYCRRIDDQLTGRCGRQGDPGESMFMLSLDDELIRVFGASERLQRRLARLGLKEGAAMFHVWLTRAIRKAQKTIEGMFLENRTQVLEYDEVAHGQRGHVYAMRRALLDDEAPEERLAAIREQVLAAIVGRTVPATAYAEQWDIAGLATAILNDFNIVLPLKQWAAEEGIGSQELQQRISRVLAEHWKTRRALFAPAELQQLLRLLFLTSLDEAWRQHLAALDDLRLAVALRSYADRHPLYEYKREAFEFFEIMLSRFREVVVQATSRIEPVQPAEKTFTARHVKRLQPCPCGSGKKFKDCHGLAAQSDTRSPRTSPGHRQPAMAEPVNSSKA